MDGGVHHAEPISLSLFLLPAQRDELEEKKDERTRG